MITSKAVQQVLDGITRYEQDLCFSDDPECECELDHDAEPATHGITYVIPNGSLDKAANKYVFGPPWGGCGDLDTVLDQPNEFPDDRSRMVVIERHTRSWLPASAYFS